MYYSVLWSGGSVFNVCCLKSISPLSCVTFLTSTVAANVSMLCVMFGKGLGGFPGIQMQMGFYLGAFDGTVGTPVFFQGIGIGLGQYWTSFLWLWRSLEDMLGFELALEDCFEWAGVVVFLVLQRAVCFQLPSLHKLPNLSLGSAPLSGHSCYFQAWSLLHCLHGLRRYRQIAH